ncbi:MAG: UDP-N-acetylmuramoyl-tripeptide--D-alanyl-D-alanine ligase [Eubacteriales bacterium]
MIPILLEEVAAAAGGKLYGDGKSLVQSVFTDSREAVSGGLFIALPGERTDGHLFVSEMSSLGCHCLVSDKNYVTGNCVLVSDTKKALYSLAEYYRREKIPSVKVIAITGSAGKTTVKDMTSLVYGAAFKTASTKGNANSLVGAPITVLSVGGGETHAVLELGMSCRGEIKSLSLLVKPFLSVITLMGSSHLMALGSKEEIRKEKLDILSGQDGGYVILDGDSEYEFSLKGKLNQKTIYCGLTNKESDFFANNIQYSPGKTTFTANRRGGSNQNQITIFTEGEHNVKNALYAFAAGVMGGVEPNDAAGALGLFTTQGDRLRIYRPGYKRKVTVIADCYNASPESMKAALKVLSTKTGRKIAVLGDMLELGEDEVDFHTENARIARETADILIFVGDFAKTCRDFLPKDPNIFAFGFSEKHRAAKLLCDIINDGDIVLFKGSRRIGLDEIIKEAGL